MNDINLIQKLKRFSHKIDDLLKIEIENLYHFSNVEKRIEVTEMFNTKNELYMPDEWVEMTLKEGNENEIIALARYSKYPEQRETSYGMNLAKILLAKGSLIKCALYENTSFISDFDLIHESQLSFPMFKNANFIERLALVRNPNISFNVLKSIYDVNDTVFNLTDNQRKDLITAFSFNEGHREQVSRIEKDYSSLWEISLKVVDSPNTDLAQFILYFIYHCCPCNDKKMLEIYTKLRNVSDKNESNEYARKMIFKMIDSLPNEKSKRKTLIPLLREGLTDSNSEIQGIAQSLLPDSETEDKSFTSIKKSFKSVKKVLGVIWFVLLTLIKFVVLFAIYSSTNSKFETITLSLLLILLLQISMMGRGWGVLIFEVMNRGVKMYNYLRKLLKDPITEEEKEAEKSFEDKTKLGWRFYVEYAIDFIFYAIAIFNLLKVTIFSQ